MRTGVSVAILAAELAIGFVATVEGRGGFGLNAQEKASMEVKIDNFSFTPPTLTVTTGTTVTRTNRDDIPHTVVSTDDTKTLKSKVLATDETFSFRCTKPCTFPYFCSLHPNVIGKA